MCVTVDVFWHFLGVFLRMALVNFIGERESVCVCVRRYMQVLMPQKDDIRCCCVREESLFFFLSTLLQVGVFSVL